MLQWAHEDIKMVQCDYIRWRTVLNCRWATHKVACYGRLIHVSISALFTEQGVSWNPANNLNTRLSAQEKHDSIIENLKHSCW